VKAVGEKIEAFAHEHPKVILALAGAVITMELYDLFDMGVMIAGFFREARRLDLAKSNAARAASEALGG
jgi:hypothetical protein